MFVYTVYQESTCYNLNPNVPVVIYIFMSGTKWTNIAMLPACSSGKISKIKFVLDVLSHLKCTQAKS